MSNPKTTRLISGAHPGKDFKPATFATDDDADLLQNPIQTKEMIHQNRNISALICNRWDTREKQQ